ncbi:MAG TPA: HlyD family secretion protein [Devosia sp.]|nr:HlyD family secretion protein [Devosia sp.]
MTEPKPGDATVVNIPRAEKAAPKAEAPVPQPPQPQAAAPELPAPKKKGSLRLILMIAVPLVLVIAGAYFWLSGGRYEDTDNAYVQQAIVSLSPDISGRVTAVSVTENQVVKAGDVMFTIDPQPYQIALDQANAALASARVNVAQLKVAYGTANTQLASAQQTLTIQQAAYDRQAALVQQGVNSSATLDQPKLSLQQAQSAVSQAQQQVAGAVAALAGNPDIATDDHPAVKAALAAVEQAQRNLQKTTVVAPADGVISQVSSLNVGQFVAQGTTIASLVETDGTWVEANFKETQLTDITTGMPAVITVDAYPGVKFDAKVTSIGAATGAEFSLIPAQNATGNWVKVVQRIPVRVDITDTKGVALRTGMSANATVDTGHSTLDKMTGH